ncbi:MAG: heparan-alpha-glucosaminide N-acetyltransferase domain-containing protein [Vicinamibacterales bacterium]
MARGTVRLVYLDWLRGLAVLIMVQAHVVDSWTRHEDRQSVAYYDAVFLGGVGAPLFLFLAGVALVLSAASKSRASGNPSIGARAALRRGGEVLVLALVFRVQSQLLGWGSLASLLKVDILNIMGLSMIAAAGLWGSSRRPGTRIALFASATAAATLLTPLVREWTPLGALPDPLEAYLRPDGRYAAFTLFPWSGFLFAGALMGELIVAVTGQAAERRLHMALLAAGVGGALTAWWAASRPALFPSAQFWTSSPTFFFIRLGIITALVPAGWAHCRFWLGDAAESTSQAAVAPRLTRPGQVMVALTRAFETLGRSSLFVYWIHVEMVYGVAAEPLKRSLPLWGSLVAVLVLCVVLYAVVLMKNRWLRGFELPSRFRIFAAVLR